MVASTASRSESESSDGGVVLYQSGMHPWIITTEPGNCPICGMKMEPIDPAKLTGEVTIDPVVVQNFGIRTSEVIAGPLVRTIRTVGVVEVAEPSARDVNLRVSGWIEDLAVDFVGAEVKVGQELFKVYSRELYAAQEEYLLALRQAQGRNNDDLGRSARDRLLNFGLTEPQIEEIARTGRAQRTVSVLSPHTGVVLDKHANEGMAVDPGMRVFRIADLSRVWVQVTMYEEQLPFVEIGLPATMQLAAVPGATYEGEVVFVDPTVNRQTRAVQVRLAFDNSKGQLKPGMFANVSLRNTITESVTLAPREAVIDTGRRAVAFVSLGQGRFEPRRVVTGVGAEGGMVQIVEGLAPGERVVTSGQFLLDSEASVRESLARMVRGSPAGDQKPAEPTDMAAGVTRLSEAAQEKIDAVAEAYLVMQTALAQDTLAGFGAALPKLRNAASHIGHLGGDDLGTLSEAVNAAVQFEADEIDAVRESFGPLSDAVIALLQQAPPSATVASADDPVYVTHCPMVNKDWLQIGDTIRNPYATHMLNCGSVESALPVVDAPARTEANHAH